MKISLLLLSVIGLAFFISCGEDEGASLSLQERVKGTWAQSRFTSDCVDETLNEMIDFECDEENCRKIILGDSTFVTITTVNGIETAINEFYLFVVGVNRVVGSEIEICNGVDFNSDCNRAFTISQDGNRLSLTRESEEGDEDESCTDTFEYVRFVEEG